MTKESDNAKPTPKAGRNLRVITQAAIREVTSAPPGDMETQCGMAVTFDADGHPRLCWPSLACDQ